MAVDRTKAPGIKIAQIFMETAHFSHRPDAVLAPTPSGLDAGDVDIGVESGATPDGSRGIVRTTVRTKRENRPHYEFEITVTALLEVDPEHPNLPMAEYVALQGPVMLFPFVRQAVADVTGKGRFGPVWINPVNFAALAGRSPSRGRKPVTAHRGKRPRD